MKQKVYWVTGASSGIGEAVVKLLSQKNQRVILSARREDELKRVKHECMGPHDDLYLLPIDLEKASENANYWVAEALAAFGRVDVLINNGGMGHLGGVLEMEETVERRVMEVNFFGQVALTRALLPHFVERKTGSIVVISSILGKFGSPRLAAYAASKHALFGYFESLREEVRAQGIHVLIVAPGFINTEVTIKSIGPDGQPINKNSPAQENGMLPEVFAKKLLSAIESNKWYAAIGKWETYAVPFKKWAPKTFFKTMSWLSGKKKK